MRKALIAYRTEKMKVDSTMSQPNKGEFLKILGNAMKDAFTPSTIKSGFKAAGIYPFDPSAIIKDKLLPAQTTDQVDGSSTVNVGSSLLQLPKITSK